MSFRNFPLVIIRRVCFITLQGFFLFLILVIFSINSNYLSRPFELIEGAKLPPNPAMETAIPMIIEPSFTFSAWLNFPLPSLSRRLSSENAHHWNRFRRIWTYRIDHSTTYSEQFFEYDPSLICIIANNEPIPYVDMNGFLFKAFDEFEVPARLVEKLLRINNILLINRLI